MWAVLAAVALGVAVWLSPSALPPAPDERPPPEAISRAVALGRPYAAADAAWLRTVQLIGNPTKEAARWPGLEDWVDLTTRLDPRFEAPYHFGALLLVGDPARAPAADRMLERGQRALPESFSLPAMRGFIAYFTMLDPASAAEHYHEAARLPGAPPYLEQFAKRLEHQGHTCAAMLRDLTGLAAHQDAHKRAAFLAGRDRMLLGCVEGQLRAAAGAFRTRTGRDGSLDELRGAGLLADEPWAPEGQCWRVDSGRPLLEPCPPPEGSP
ncbi:MAG: hypothetical protein IT383_02175 [Deltaproteobacteria bacterium]|nr:hypothetical protein [Deltaproteobacteria bacterium]